MRKILLLTAVWLGFLVPATAQIRSISGRVTDTSGNAIPFATIQIKGKTEAAAADADGKFTIRAKTGDVLVISSTGIQTKTVRVDNSTGALNVQVSHASGEMAEVIVTTALGIRRQAKELGYATTSIKSATLNQAAVTNAATGIAAKISGVDIRLADNGVNPQVKVTFRGSRSIEGNNSALVIVDGVPVDQSYLANLNPSDIQDVTVLKGSNAAALYGMEASNGVMVITTKKGRGHVSLNYSNTVSFETISYFPNLQNEYSGYGGEPGGAQPDPTTGGDIYFINPFSGYANTVPFENESYGQAYNNLDNIVDSIPIGINAAGKWLYIPFKAAPNGRKDFFQTGIGDQNKLSAQLGNSWGGLFISGEHTSKQGVVPKDRYDRNGFRVNGNLNFGRFTASGGISYNDTYTNVAGNSFDQNRPVYWDVMNQLPSTDLKAIENTSQLENSQGFINAYFPNPWWQVNNSRATNNTWQTVSNLQLNYKILPWLSITARGGYSRSATNAPSYIDSITYPTTFTNGEPTEFAAGGLWGEGSLGTTPGTIGFQKEIISDHYSDLNGDLFLSGTKKVNDFSFTLVAGTNYRDRESYGKWWSNQVNSGPVAGENVVPTVTTKVNNPDGSAYAIYQYKRYDQAVYGDLVVGYDDWLFLHGSFRNDWTSILSPQDRSFSYPSVDLSAVLSDKLASIKNSKTISFLKVRVGYAGTGNVSIDGYQRLGVMGNIGGGTNVPGQVAGGYSALLPNFGAYQIYPLATEGTGFPYGSTSGYSLPNEVVQNGLKPEKTASFETGFQLGLLHNRVNIEATYYDQVASNQTIPLQTSNATGISSYLTNAGKLNNSGFEVDLDLTPLIRIGKNFRFSLQETFSTQNSKVISIAGGQAELDQIFFGTVNMGGIFAVAGKAYPQIMTTDFMRDPKGQIIVNGTTGLPSFNPALVDAGQANYKIFLGTLPTFTYKNFHLTATFDYRGGAKILNEEGNAMDFAGISASDATNRYNFVVPNSVINVGTATSPKYSPNTNIPISSVGGDPVAIYWWANYYNQLGMPYVTSANFIKLREINLTYDFPSEWLGQSQKRVFKALSVSLIGRNLFMWRPKTNGWSDPEYSTNATGNAVGYTTEYQTPPTRILSATVSATIF